MTSKKYQSTTNVSIAISDLAPLCGMDHYNNFGKVACKLWSQLHPSSYNQYKLEAYKNGNYVANDSMKQKMAVLNSKLTDGKINVIGEVAQINKCKNNTVELNTKQGELYNKLQSVIDEKASTTTNQEDLSTLKKQAQELHNIIKSSTNTVYGTRNENSGYKFFEEATQLSIKKRQKFMFQKLAGYSLASGERINWTLKGVADGITTSDELVEIKNRQKKLFNTIRDYEMCQIQTYLHLLGADTGYLVELITDSENQLTGNIIKVEKQVEYFNAIIVGYLDKLISFMMNLFYFDTENRMFTEDERHTILSNLISGDNEKLVHNVIYC